MDLALIESGATAVERLRHSVELRRQADIDEVRAIAELAAEHSWTTTDEFDVIGERAVRLGADGCRLVGEFLPLEVAAIKGISVNAATWLIRDVLNLEARHPVLWDAVRAGHVAPFRAFQLAQLAAHYELTREQALTVDSGLAGKFGRIAWPRLMRLARGLIAIVAADKIEAAAKAAREARFMRSAPVEDQPIVTELWARLDTADAQQLEATVAALAKILAAEGDSESLDVRRAKALGILATPDKAAALLTGDATTAKKYRPRANVFLHLSGEAVTGASVGVARCETMGPITMNQLAELFGTHHITITPVVRTGGDEPAGTATRSPNASAKLSGCVMCARCSRTPPGAPGGSISTTPSPSCPASRYRPGPGTSARSPGESTAPRPPTAGGSANLGPASSGGGHPPVSVTVSAPAVPTTCTAGHHWNARWPGTSTAARAGVPPGGVPAGRHLAVGFAHETLADAVVAPVADGPECLHDRTAQRDDGSTGPVGIPEHRRVGVPLPQRTGGDADRLRLAVHRPECGSEHGAEWGQRSAERIGVGPAQRVAVAHGVRLGGRLPRPRRGARPRR